MNGKFLHVFLFLVFVFSARFGIGIVSNTALPQALPGIQVSGGNLNATVDISVPEGTHGLTPNLDLVYNSAAGTGLLGLGWELSGLHSVSRDPSYPISYSDSDRFSSSVSGGLIQNGGTQEYGTNPETLMKYKFNGESWTAKDRSGTVYQFGSDDSRNSRVKSPERGTDRNAVRKWGLDSVKDLNGNSYTVDYDGSQELLPVKIEYGSGNRTVEFGYDSALKNKGAREGYVYSSKVLEESILKSITMKAGGTKVREYVFSYDVSSADGIPRLNKIDRTDYINGQAEFYSIALGYTADQAVSISQTPKSLDLDETFVLSRTPMSDKMTCVQDERDCYEAANTNCVSGATYISCRTRHNEVIRACNEYTRLWKNPCFLGVTLPNNTMTVGDVNADGKPEIFRLIGSEDAKNIRIAKTSVNADGSLSDDKNSSPVLQNVNYRTFSTMGWGDADGDGKTDFAYSDGANLLVMYSNGSGFDPPVRMANVSAVIPAFNYFTDMPDRKWKGGLIDINGDGKADYVTVENDKLLSVYLSGGKSFQNRISLSLDDPIYKGAGEDEQTGMFLDMDGDRIPEIVFWETNGYSVMKLSSDFTRAYRTPTLVFPSGENTGDRLNRWQVDMNSDGKQDIVILRDLGSGRLSMDIYYYRGYTPGQVSFEKAVFAVPSEMRFLKKEDLQNNSVLPNKTFADINGDRFPDLVLSDGNITKVYYSSKNSFTDSGISLPSGSLWLAMDVNGDGRAEIFTHKADNDNLLRVTPVTDIFIKIQSHNESRKEARALRRGAELGSAAGAAAGTAAFGFAGGSAVGAYYGAQLGAGIVKYQASMNVNRISTSSLWGWLSFIAQLFYSQKSTIAYYPSPYASRQGLLSTVSDSSPFFEKTVSVTYDYIRNFSSAVKIGTGSYPNLSFPSNETLVKTVSVSDGGGRTDTDTYDYEDTRYIAGDRDSFAQLGFRKITVTHQPENTKEETLIYQTGKLLAGKTESVRAWNSAGSLSSESFHSYTAVSPFGRNLVLPQTQTAKKYRLGNLLLTSSETVSYDLYGNPVSRSVSAGSQNSEEQ
ncbi:MAG TPA: SpvB/TcaC N-terminal domain-containing protein, partial [Leptospiraceae bacterium]|nr:SpvB/TcaC N-terminal domain-containing protein [Leptospiraceae bacterium]